MLLANREIGCFNTKLKLSTVKLRIFNTLKYNIKMLLYN